MQGHKIGPLCADSPAIAEGLLRALCAGVAPQEAVHIDVPEPNREAVVLMERHGFVGAGAVVGPGKVVGEGELWVGNPARPARMLKDSEIEALHYSADHYVRLKDEYLG